MLADGFVTYYLSAMSRKVATTNNKRGEGTPKGPGLMHSLYFPRGEDLEKVRAAAKIRGVKLSVMMRDGCVAEAERVLKRAKKAA